MQSLMIAAITLAVGLLLAAGIVLAGAPLLRAVFGFHPIAAARAALAGGGATAVLFASLAGLWLRG